jgi:hypothetical protein
MNLNEQSHNNNQVTANAFNEYFSMVAEKLLINNDDNSEVLSYLHKNSIIITGTFSDRLKFSRN